MAADPLVTKLNILCAQKDEEIAKLRQSVQIEELRRAVGAPETAVFDAREFVFIVPAPAEG